MTKKQKYEIAKKCLDQIKELKLEVKIQHGWILLEPPINIPFELTRDISQCGKQLIKLLNASTQSA